MIAELAYGCAGGRLVFPAVTWTWIGKIICANLIPRLGNAPLVVWTEQLSPCEYFSCTILGLVARVLNVLISACILSGLHLIERIGFHLNYQRWILKVI